MEYKKHQNFKCIIKASTLKDLDDIKLLADESRQELGFVLKPALRESIRNRSLYVVKRSASSPVVGFVHFRNRKDRVTKIYQICIDRCVRRLGFGSKLIKAVLKQAAVIGQIKVALQCPEDLPANYFYYQNKFSIKNIVQGKRRRLIVWELELIHD